MISHLLKRLLKLAVLLSFIWCIAWFICRPVVVLHYAADTKEPVTYFYNENNDIIRDHLVPGQVKRFYTPMFPNPDFWIDISAPFSSRDGVEIKPPFSRVDVYIDAETKFRLEKKYGFFERFK